MYRFNRQLRITRKREIDRVFQTAKFRKSSGPLTILRIRNDFKHPRLGIAVPKRVVAKAVDRNRVKRVIRNWFRLNQHKLEVADLMVLVNRRIQGPRDVRKNLEQLQTSLFKSDM